MSRISGEYIAPVPFAGTGELINRNGERLTVPSDVGGTAFVSIVNGYGNSVSPLEARGLAKYIAGSSDFRLVEGEGDYAVEPPAERIKNIVTFRGYRGPDGTLYKNGYVTHIEPVAALFVQWLHGMPFSEEQADQVEHAYRLHLGMGIRLSEDRTGVVFPEGQRLEVVTVFDRRETEEEKEIKDGGINTDFIWSSTPSRSSDDLLPKAEVVKLGDKYRNSL